MLAEQVRGNSNLAVADKSLVIFLELIRQIPVIRRHAKRSFQPVWTQVSEGIDLLKPGAIGEVKERDRIVQLAFVSRFRQVRKGETLERRGQHVAMSRGLFEKMEQGLDRVAPS